MTKTEYVKLTREQKIDLGFYEVNNEVSLTVPEQSMSLKEIIERYVKGQQLDVGKNVYYDDPDDFDSVMDIPPDFDLSDAELIFNEIAENQRVRKESELKDESEESERVKQSGKNEVNESEDVRNEDVKSSE